MPSHTLFRTLLKALSLFALAALPAVAQPGAGDTTDREIKFVVPVEPGGGIDAVARIIANHWTAELKQPVVVINRSGASGNIGTASVARTKPEAQTLLVTGISHITSPMLHSNPGYDAVDDFSPVARFATAPNVLVVGETLKGMTLAQILQDPRSGNQGLSFGSAGYGHTSHISAELFMSRTGSRWLHVPYKGTAPALRALMGGEVQLMFVPASSVATAVASGKVHPVAVAHHERLPQLHDIPTLRELGVKSAEFAQWYGLMAPRAIPSEKLKQLSALSLRALQSPTVGSQLKALGVEPDPAGHEDFAKFIAAEHQRLGAILTRERMDRPLK